MDQEALFGPSVDSFWKKKQYKARSSLTSIDRLPANIKKIFGEAETAYINEDNTKAVELLFQVSKLAPKLPEPYTLLASIYEKSNNQLLVLQLLCLAAERSKSQSKIELWEKILKLSLKIQDYQIACKTIVSLLRSQPDINIQYVKMKILIFIRTGRMHLAFDTLKTYQAKYPNDIEIIHSVAIDLLDAGYDRFAYNYYTEIVESYCISKEEDITMFFNQPKERVDYLIQNIDNLYNSIQRFSLLLIRFQEPKKAITIIENVFALYHTIKQIISENEYKLAFPLHFSLLLAYAKLSLDSTDSTVDSTLAILIPIMNQLLNKETSVLYQTPPSDQDRMEIDTDDESVQNVEPLEYDQWEDTRLFQLYLIALLSHKYYLLGVKARSLKWFSLVEEILPTIPYKLAFKSNYIEAYVEMLEFQSTLNKYHKMKETFSKLCEIFPNNMKILRVLSFFPKEFLLENYSTQTNQIYSSFIHQAVQELYSQFKIIFPGDIVFDSKKQNIESEGLDVVNDNRDDDEIPNEDDLEMLVDKEDGPDNDINEDEGEEDGVSPLSNLQFPSLDTQQTNSTIHSPTSLDHYSKQEQYFSFFSFHRSFLFDFISIYTSYVEFLFIQNSEETHSDLLLMLQSILDSIDITQRRRYYLRVNLVQTFFQPLVNNTLFNHLPSYLAVKNQDSFKIFEYSLVRTIFNFFAVESVVKTNQLDAYFTSIFNQSISSKNISSELFVLMKDHYVPIQESLHGISIQLKRKALVSDTIDLTTPFRRRRDSSNAIDPFLAAARKFSEECQSLALELLENLTDIKTINLLFRLIIEENKSLPQYPTEFNTLNYLEYNLPPRSLHNYNSTSLISNLLMGHDLALYNKHQEAIESYLYAFAADPNQPLVSLCLSTYLITNCSHPLFRNRMEMALKGFAFLLNYQRLRLDFLASPFENSSVNHLSPKELALFQETLYNFGRAFQDLELNHLAINSYNQALDLAKNHPQINQEVNVTKETAFNLSLLYKHSGAKDLAFEIMTTYLMF